MSDCEVTLLWYLSELSLPSSLSLVWALFVRLAFLLMSCERSLVWLPRFFFAISVGTSTVSYALARPVQLAPGCE